MECNQFGFIPGSNTTQALIALVHRWSETCTVDKAGGCARSLLTDYRKAFDLVVSFESNHPNFPPIYCIV